MTQHAFRSSKVMGVCPSCKQTFIRDADSHTVSMSYSRIGAPNPDADPRMARSYPQWVASAGNYCDDCMPPIPKPVVKDMIREQELRVRDKEQLRQSSSYSNVPMHLPRRTPPTYNGKEDEPKIGTVLGNDGVDVRTTQFGQGNVRQAAVDSHGRPVRVGGGAGQGEAGGGRVVVRGTVLAGDLRRGKTGSRGPNGGIDSGVDLEVRGKVRG